MANYDFYLVCESLIFSAVSAVSAFISGRGGGIASGEVRTEKAGWAEGENGPGSSQMPSIASSRPSILVRGRGGSPYRGLYGASYAISMAVAAVIHYSPCRLATFSGSPVSTIRTALRGGLPVFNAADGLRGRAAICLAFCVLRPRRVGP